MFTPLRAETVILAATFIQHALEEYVVGGTKLTRNCVCKPSVQKLASKNLEETRAKNSQLRYWENFWSPDSD